MTKRTTAAALLAALIAAPLAPLAETRSQPLADERLRLAQSEDAFPDEALPEEELRPGPRTDQLEEELSEAARRAIEQFLAMAGPMLEQFGQMVGDLPQYEAPIMLPNGDILIRRKRPELGSEEEIEL
ncbi:MAG: hypothetical protein AAFW46_06975 [Pseudomonadota bacterium]